MKTKIIALITAAATLFCLTACQPTPDRDIVVKKDSERMIEKAQSEEEGNKTLSAIDAPEHYTHESEGAGGKLRIKVDADVVVPDVESMPIVRASMDLLTQEQVTGMFNYFFPDEKPTTGKQQVETKKVIEQELLNLKRMLSEEDYSQFSKDDLEAQISILEDMYIDAPESAPDSVVLDGIMRPGETEQDPNWLGLSGETEDYRFSATTRTVLAGDDIHNENIGVSYNVKNGDRSYRDMAGHTWKLGAADMPADVPQRLTLPYEEAEKLCQDLLAAAGIEQDFVIGAVKVIDNYSDTKEGRPIDYTYQFHYTRQANGVPLFFNPVQYTFTSLNEEFNFRWHYEELVIQVDNDGIANMHWTTPIRIGETVTENAALKPFEEVMTTFEGMMNTIYGGVIKTHFNDQVELDVTVTDMELCLLRVREKNADAMDGLLVPAWVFYGSNKGTNEDGDELYFPDSQSIIDWVSEFITEYVPIEGERELSLWDDLGREQKRDSDVLLVVNAVDGSIIDITKGY